ncbi:hypothetical protein ACWD5R_44040 [Streptomyces sp. NPDC002514]|uniref:hypothetical protein n=1 Tax=Streptomyces sp. NPDC001270 TaxID=3364554 RepID=UPI003691C1DA
MTIQLALDTGKSLYLDSQKTAVAGSDISHSWGGLKKSDAPDCSVAGYMKASTGNYYTPNISVC